jgi:type II secretory pathway component PulL
MPDHSRLDIPALLKQLDAVQPNVAAYLQLELEQLKGFLSVRTAEMVNKELAATAVSISQSANLLKTTLENSSDYLINAIRVNTEKGTANAQQIGEEITSLTGALTTAGAELRSAGTQSAALGRRLNWLTAILVAAALISAGATAFYAWETKRQVDLMQQQIQRTTQIAPQPSRIKAVPSVQH